jgi:hypothetical protein
MYLVLITERTRSLGRPESEWDDNIIMGLREIRCEGGGLHSFTSGAFVNTVMNLQVPQKAENFLSN